MDINLYDNIDVGDDLVILIINIHYDSKDVIKLRDFPIFTSRILRAHLFKKNNSTQYP